MPPWYVSYVGRIETNHDVTLWIPGHDSLLGRLIQGQKGDETVTFIQK